MAQRLKTTNKAIDPLAELKKNLENLDSLEAALGVSEKQVKASPPPMPTKATMPPSLPGQNRTGTTKSVSTPKSSLPPSLPDQKLAQLQPPPLGQTAAKQGKAPLDVGGYRASDFLCPEMPPPLPDPGENPFNEPAEARMPRAASPEEKVDYFRGVIKAKSESLARAKSLYLARVGETKRLREVIDALNRQIDRISVLQSLPMELEEMKNRLAESERRAEATDDLKDELDATTQRCADLEQAIETFEMKLLKLQARIKVEKQAATAANETCETLTAEREDLNRKIQSLEATLADNKSELSAYDQLKGDFATLEARALSAEAQVDLKEALKAKLEADLESLQEKLRSEKADFSKELKERDKSQKTALSEQEKLLNQRRARELDDMKAKYEAECRVLQGQLDVASSQLQISREECEKLVVEKEDVRQKLERQLEEQKKKLFQERDEALAEAEDRRRTDLGDMQRLVDGAKKEGARQLVEQEKRLRQEFDEDLALERRQLEEKEQAAAEAYENEIRKLEEASARDLEEMEKLRVDAHKAISALKSSELAAAQKMESMKADFEQKMNEALDDQEARHSRKLQELKSRQKEEMEAAKGSGVELKAKLAEALDEVELLNRELDATSAQCDDLQAQLDNSKADQATLEASLQAARDRASALEMKSQQDTQAGAELERTVASLKADLATTKEKLETSRQASAALRQENRRLQQESANLQIQVRNAATDQEDVLAEAQEKARQLDVKNASLLRQISTLQAQLDDVNAKGGEEAQAALEREMVARKSAESRAKELEKALAMATQALRDAAKAGLVLGANKGR